MEPSKSTLKSDSDHTNGTFVQEYCSLIARLNSLNCSLAWWATWIPSKNKTSSLSVKHCYSIWHDSNPAELAFLTKLQIFSKAVSHSIRVSLRIAKNAFISRRALAELFQSLCSDRETPFYLIKSFLLQNPKDSGDSKDPYFGNLAELASNPPGNHKVLTIVDPLCDFNKALAHCRASDRILPLHFFLEPYDLIRVWGRIILGLFTSPKGPIRFAEKDVTSVFRYQYFFDLLSSTSIHSLCHYYAIKNISKTLKLSHFVYTWENNPWERMCVLALRTFSPKTQIIGYQHTIVSPGSMNLFLGTDESLYAPIPDRVVTAGQEAVRVIREFSQEHRLKLSVGFALRQSSSYKTESKNETIKNTILILLDLIETSDFAKNIIANLENNNDWKVIVRKHPAHKWSAIISHLNVTTKALPKNIALSECKSLREDLERADIAIYSASASAIEAIAIGLPVIYVSRENDICFDPLYRLTDLRWIYDKSRSIVPILEEIKNLPLEQLNAQRFRARAFSEQFFGVNEPASLKEFII